MLGLITAYNTFKVLMDCIITDSHDEKQQTYAIETKSDMLKVINQHEVTLAFNPWCDLFLGDIFLNQQLITHLRNHVCEWYDHIVRGHKHRRRIQNQLNTVLKTFCEKLVTLYEILGFDFWHYQHHTKYPIARMDERMPVNFLSTTAVFGILPNSQICLLNAPAAELHDDRNGNSWQTEHPLPFQIGPW